MRFNKEAFDRGVNNMLDALVWLFVFGFYGLAWIVVIACLFIIAWILPWIAIPIYLILIAAFIVGYFDININTIIKKDK